MLFREEKLNFVVSYYNKKEMYFVSFSVYCFFSFLVDNYYLNYLFLKCDFVECLCVVR